MNCTMESLGWLAIALCTLMPFVVAEHNLNQFPTRSVIAQMFEWKFLDIATECEVFLGPKGYGAVQVSPVTEHAIFENRPWRERYQTISYKIKTRSGGEKEFKEMTRRCNASGVRVYVDVILNHMAGENPAPYIGTAGSVADPKSMNYPAVPYTSKHFNTPCAVENWNDGESLRDCEVAGRRDLNHTVPYVRTKLVDFLNHLIDLGVAGFKIDSAKHIWSQDLEHIFYLVKDLNTDFGFPPKSRAFVLSELVDFGSNDDELGRWEYKHVGRISDFLLPSEFGRAFRGYNDLKYLKNWGPQWAFLPSHLGVVFVVDHEIERGQGLGYADVVTFRDPKLFKMASAFMLAHPHGTPRVLTSYRYENADHGPPSDSEGNIKSPFENKDAKKCTDEWVCEHRWQPISSMIRFRNVAFGTDLNNWWDNAAKHIAFSRGNRAFIAINGDKRRTFDWAIQTCLPAGRYCDITTGELLNGKCTGQSVEVDENGEARIVIEDDSDHGVFAIHVEAAILKRKTSENVSFRKFISKYWTTKCYRGSKSYWIGYNQPLPQH